MRVNGIVASLSVVLALAVPAAAEHPAAIPVTHEELGRALDDLAGQLHGLGDRWRGHFVSGAPGERPLISIMLSHREELALSAAQVQELERLRGEFQKQAIKHDAALRVAEMDLTAFLNKDTVDMATTEAKVREIERVRADLRLARIRTIENGKAVLTPEQRSKLAGLLSDSWSFRPRAGESHPPRGTLPHNL